MEATQAVNPNDPKVLSSYEGLVIKTSSLVWNNLRAGTMDFEDVCQAIRLKVWQSLSAWDPISDPRTERKLKRGVPEKKLRDAYVFGNVKNLVKDLYKMDERAHKPLLIEDIAPSDSVATRGTALRSRFEEQYLSIEDEEVFKAVEETNPLIPSTITDNERLVLACLYLGYNGPETATRLGMEQRKVATATRNIRRKMADWKPTATQVDEPVGDLVTV